MPPDFFGTASRNVRYFGTIKKMLYEDTMARVHWQEDGTTSIVDIDILQLETLMPKKQVSNESPCCSKGKFNLHIKPAALCQIQLMMRMLMVILMLTSKNKH